MRFSIPWYSGSLSRIHYRKFLLCEKSTIASWNLLSYTFACVGVKVRTFRMPWNGSFSDAPGISSCVSSIASLSFDQDPTTIVYDQDSMHSHIIDCLKSGTMVPFPVKKHRRPANRIANIETCEVHCDCRMPFEGETMVCCDQCDRWYHENCTNVPICSESAWFCQHCIPNK